MKTVVGTKNGYQSDDDNVRYKLNTQYFNNIAKPLKKKEKSDEDDVRYMLPTVLNKPIKKQKQKPKIKVNFWANKPVVQQNSKIEHKSSRRHTIAEPSHIAPNKTKNNSVKVRKRVSFLPSPLLSDNLIPMVTVPDDLTIQLNEEEANDLGQDLNTAFSTNQNEKRNSKGTVTQANQRRKRNEEQDTRIHGNENELEFFSKYVVQKLRRMETNQRIYSENLINTVLMLGQLGKLNGKSKIAE